MPPQQPVVAQCSEHLPANVFVSHNSDGPFVLHGIGEKGEHIGCNSQTSSALPQHTSQSINSKAPKPHAPLRERRHQKNWPGFLTKCTL